MSKDALFPIKLWSILFRNVLVTLSADSISVEHSESMRETVVQFTDHLFILKNLKISNLSTQLITWLDSKNNRLGRIATNSTVRYNEDRRAVRKQPFLTYLRAFSFMYDLS